MTFTYLRTCHVYVKLTAVMKANQRSKAKTTYSDLALARKSATSPYVWQRPRGKHSGRALQWNKGKAQVCPTDAIGLGKLEVSRAS